MYSEIFHIGPGMIIGAFLLDIILGEPERLPHPVAIMGKFIAKGEGRLNRDKISPAEKRIRGLLLAFFLSAAAFFLTATIIALAYRLHAAAGAAVSIILAYTTLSARGLHRAAFRVKRALDWRSLEGARDALSHIVGRSTRGLDEGEIVRGAVETVSENTSDGVIAPLFYMAVGGVPLAMAYKAVNTLDSMVGYRNERYGDFGRASARMDDLANLVPARLTAILMVMAAFILRLDWRGALRVLLRDRQNHPSPNSGYPEAAAAGALGVQLGGLNRYPGRTEERPAIGDPVHPLKARHIKEVVMLMYISSVMMVGMVVTIRGCLHT